MEIIDVVNKLIGPIDPVGDSAIDVKRFSNLEAMCALVNKLLYDIHHVAIMGNSQQASVKKAGKYAQEFIAEIKEAD